MPARPPSLRSGPRPSEKRPMGSGSIEERDGRFRARLRVRGKRLDLGTYDSREEAAAVLQAAVDRFATEGESSTGALTLRTWIDRWLETRDLSGAVRSAYDDRSRLRAHVLDEPWADDPIDTITTKQLRGWVQSLMLRRVRRHDGRGSTRQGATTLSRHTVAHVYRTLSVCLRDAVEAGHIEENPARGIRLPKVLYTREPWTYLSQPEINQLLSCAAIPESHRLLFAVAIYTGCRKGELWGLRWGDVYLDHLTPHLMVRRSGKAATKNGKIRMVPLLAQARTALERLQALVLSALPAQRGRRNDAGIDAELLVFPAADGSMRSRWDVARWKPRRVPYLLVDGTRKHRIDPGYRQLAGITRAVRFHDLRHTCASHLLMGTWGRCWRLEEVRDLLGHSDVTVTQRYAHLAPDRLHAAAAATTITAVPTPAPSTAPSSIASPPEVAVPAAESARSHLRGSNPWPTVYESGGGSRNLSGNERSGASLGPADAPSAAELLIAAATAPLDVRAARAFAAAYLDQEGPRLARAVLAETDDAGAIAAAVALAALALDVAASPPRARTALAVRDD